MKIHELIELIYEGGESARDAAETIGILFESFLRGDRNQEQDAVDRSYILKDYRNHHLTKDEFESAVDELVRYIDGTTSPLIMAVWALTKSHDNRALPLWKKLLLEHMKNPDKRDIAYHALNSIWLSSDYESAVPLVKLAAREAVGDVKELAENIIEVYPSLFQDQT